MANNLNQSAYADHLRGCADLAIEITTRMNIHDDAARQATFATVIINAERHNIFMEPHPEHSKTPVEKAKAGGGTAGQPEPAAVSEPLTKKVDDNETAAVAKDEAAARKADAQILDAPRNPTAEQADGAKRQALLVGISSARDLLNKAGHVPPVTPKGLNAYIANQFKDPPRTELGQLDTDELGRLTMLLASKLDVLREKNSKSGDDF